MPYRKDKFKVGDIVAWSDNNYAKLTDGVNRFGHGPFVIETVIDREYENGYGDQSNWSSMGHTQHVKIDAAKNNSFSGAFFKKLENN
jgi:hypothetical protein